MHALESDEQLAVRVQRGEIGAFAQLVSPYEDKLTRYLRRILRDADDVADTLQDVFIKVYEQIQGFDASQKFSPWIYRIAHNEAVNVIRKRRTTPLSWFDPDVLLPHFIAVEKSDTESERSHMKQILDTILEKIDEGYRAILILHYYDEMSYKDIAEVLRIPVSSVGVKIYRGKKMVEKLLAEKNIHTYE